MILIKRAYDKHSPKDGRRFLVDRLWPRGLTKEGPRELERNNAAALKEFLEAR